MNYNCSKQILRGRPYGDVGVLWRKSLSKFIRIYKSDVHGRCLALWLDIIKNVCIILIVVYFPCFASTPKYIAELAECLGFFETSLLKRHNEALNLGDYNFE